MTIAELIALVAGALTTLISITDALLIKMFKKNRAFSSDSAIKTNDLSVIKRWRLKRMERSGVVIRLSPVLCYYDKPLADRIRNKHRKRAAVVLPVILILFLLIYFIVIR